jgi:serine carboxypeptidase-like clade IV
VIWLTGGPGCSSELALFYENGPFNIADNLSLVWNDFGWDKVHIVLLLLRSPIRRRNFQGKKQDLERLQMCFLYVLFGSSVKHCFCLCVGWPPQASNLIYVDQPTGTGFSYSSDSRDTRHNEATISNDLYDFLQVMFIYPVLDMMHSVILPAPQAVVCALIVWLNIVEVSKLLPSSKSISNKALKLK